MEEINDKQFDPNYISREHHEERVTELREIIERMQEERKADISGRVEQAIDVPGEPEIAGLYDIMLIDTDGAIINVVENVVAKCADDAKYTAGVEGDLKLCESKPSEVNVVIELKAEIIIGGDSNV